MAELPHAVRQMRSICSSTPIHIPEPIIESVPDQVASHRSDAAETMSFSDPPMFSVENIESVTCFSEASDMDLVERPSLPALSEYGDGKASEQPAIHEYGLSNIPGDPDTSSATSGKNSPVDLSTITIPLHVGDKPSSSSSKGQGTMDGANVDTARRDRRRALDTSPGQSKTIKLISKDSSEGKNGMPGSITDTALAIAQLTRAMEEATFLLEKPFDDPHIGFPPARMTKPAQPHDESAYKPPLLRGTVDQDMRDAACKSLDEASERESFLRERLRSERATRLQLEEELQGLKDLATQSATNHAVLTTSTYCNLPVPKNGADSSYLKLEANRQEKEKMQDNGDGLRSHLSSATRTQITLHEQEPRFGADSADTKDQGERGIAAVKRCDRAVEELRVANERHAVTLREPKTDVALSDTLIQEKRALEAKVKHREALISSLRRDLERSKSLIEKLQRDRKEHGAKLSKLQNINTRLEKQLKEVKQRALTLMSDLKKLEASKAELARKSRYLPHHLRVPPRLRESQDLLPRLGEKVVP